MARILAELGADEGTVSAALLHDVLDKTLLVEAQLRPMLQDDAVAELVKQVRGWCWQGGWSRAAGAF